MKSRIKFKIYYYYNKNSKKMMIIYLRDLIYHKLQEMILAVVDLKLQILTPK
jgi:hypothetical protein